MAGLDFMFGAWADRDEPLARARQAAADLDPQFVVAEHDDHIDRQQLADRSAKLLSRLAQMRAPPPAWDFGGGRNRPVRGLFRLDSSPGNADD